MVFGSVALECNSFLACFDAVGKSFLKKIGRKIMIEGRHHRRGDIILKNKEVNVDESLTVVVAYTKTKLDTSLSWIRY